MGQVCLSVCRSVCLSVGLGVVRVSSSPGDSYENVTVTRARVWSRSPLARRSGREGDRDRDRDRERDRDQVAFPSSPG